MNNTKLKAAFDNFLETKLVPLDQKIKFVIFMACLILPVVVFLVVSYLPKNDQITALDKQLVDLEKQIADARERAAQLDKYTAEMEETEERFLAASVLLPQQKEIPSLLTNISSLGTNSGLDFISFQPGGERPMEFYAEIPLSIAVRGPYHNVGTFLYKISKLGRIVAVSNLSLGGGAIDRGEMMLSANLNLVTYRFIEMQNDDQTPKK